MIKQGEVVCDMFCGVGPLSLQAAKMGARVIANDLNPACFKYLKLNISKNNVRHMVIPFGIDARKFFICLTKYPKECLEI